MVYIKQIIIQGFKSYKDQTDVEPFSPKSNVVVGRNGSGKSNFFAAVRFVLGDDYTSMSREERQALLHEGSGSAVMSAFVELIFDNSDRRFPNEKNELHLRRTIGVKKDEYSIDRKNATKTEVYQMLEAAGFARQNPFYIVPQGRVTHLTNMKDSERLVLLKDISGSSLYEERRTSSLRVLAETDAKRKSIDDTIEQIDQRLKELGREKTELEEYNNRDRERRGLRFAIERQREVELERQIAEIDERRQTGVARSDDQQDRFVQNEREMDQIDTEIAHLQSELGLLRADRAQLEDERREAARSKAKIELDVKRLTDGRSNAQQAQRRQENSLREVQQRIKDREAELERLLPEYQAKKEQENDVRSQLEEAEDHRKRLEDKQGRTAFYSNKRQRDDALRAQIDGINQDMAQQKAILMDIRDTTTELQSTIEQLRTEIEDLRSNIDQESDNTMNMATQLEQARDAKRRLEDKRKELWREDYHVKQKIPEVQARLTAAENKMYQKASVEQKRGLRTLEELKREGRAEGVYGTIAELIQVKENYRAAAESHAGNSLFNVVVDNDTTSSKLIEQLNQRRGGRLTFMPLNQMRSHNVEYPQSNDVVPLIDKITYDQQFDGAVRHIFDRAVVVPDLKIAGSVARTHGLTALAIDGNKSDRKGRLEGGYRDPSKQSLDAMDQVRKVRDEMAELRDRRDRVDGELQKIDQLITKAQSEVGKIQEKRSAAETSYGPMRQQLRAKEAELQKMEETLEQQQRAAAKLESAINSLGNQQSDLEAELGTDFKKMLSQEEEETLASLTVSVQTLRKQVDTLTAERSELEGSKTEIDLELRDNLRPYLNQLLAQASSTSGSGGDGEKLREAERTLERVNETLQDVESKITEVDEKIEQANVQLIDLTESKAQKKAQNDQLALAIEKQQKRMTKSTTDRQRLQEELRAVQQQIREQGSLPEEVWQKYVNQNVDKLSARLQKVQHSLKKYSHVNKKAFEQFENYNRQKANLTARQAELISGRASIEELITHLDQRKDEAINRTFKQVSKAFSEIFVQLVPMGTGKLVIQRKSDREAGNADSDDDEEDAPRPKKGSIESYAGVGIQVSFNSKHDEQQRISQLSGGQKSLCALALVFAIQQCDPAPFYLFDEIDANLDQGYRQAVAEMLKKLSGKGGEKGGGGGQFICTTFRPELVRVADKCYGVNYSNKTSSVDVVAREHALQFVEEAAAK